MIYTITLNPTIDKIVYVDKLKVKELNRVNEVLYSAAGKGINVSKTIKKEFNEDAIALGFVGGNNGEFIKSELDARNVKHDFNEVKENTRENVKVMDADGNLTEINEKGPKVTKEDIEDLINKIQSLVKENDVVVMSGSVCPGVEKDIYKRIIEIAKGNKAKTILDADDELFKIGIEALPNSIKPNTFELCNYFGIEETDDIQVLKMCCQKLIDKGIEEVMLSMGKDGAFYLDKECCYRIEPLNIKVKSTAGAGDAMVAVMALALENNMNTIEKIKMAVASSAGACLTEGTEPSSKSVVEELMKQVIIKSF